MDAEQSIIVFGADMDLLDTLMGVSGESSHNYFVLDGGFNHVHFLTNDHKGETVLQLLCDLYLRESLDKVAASLLSHSPEPCFFLRF